jgi:cytochrome P450
MHVPRTLPLDRPVQLEPPPGYAALRTADPVARVRLPDGGDAWLLTRYDDVRAVLGDPRFGVNPPGTDETGNPSLAQDGPGHRRLRRLMSRAFTPTAVEAYVPRVRELAGALTRDLVAAGPGTDLVARLGRPLPLLVISEILGIRVTDREQFESWVEAANALVVTSGDPDRAADFAAAGAALWAFTTALVAEKRATPGPDLLSLLAAGQDEDRLTDPELAVAVITLLTTGYLTDPPTPPARR